jgi:hypothetical protein
LFDDLKAREREREKEKESYGSYNTKEQQQSGHQLVSKYLRWMRQ